MDDIIKFVTLGTYIPIVLLGLPAVFMFMTRFAIPLFRHRPAQVHENYLGLSAAGLLMGVVIEQPLYWVIRNVDSLTWLNEMWPLVATAKILYMVSVTLALAGLIHAASNVDALRRVTGWALGLWLMGVAIAILAQNF